MVSIANVKKYSDMKSIGHLCAHYERSVANDNYSNPCIDKNKLELDRKNYAPNREMKQTDYIKQQIESVMNGRKMRKDAVRMCCWIVDMPASVPEEREQEFFSAVYNFLVARYGEKSGMGENVVISAYVHKSETTFHMHFAFLPVLERDEVKRFVAKEVVDRKDLETFHEELGSYLEDLKICKKSDILNGNTKRKSDGRAYSVKELKQQKHIEMKREWKGEKTVGRGEWKR